MDWKKAWFCTATFAFFHLLIFCDFCCSAPYKGFYQLPPPTTACMPDGNKDIGRTGQCVNTSQLKNQCWNMETSLAIKDCAKFDGNWCCYIPLPTIIDSPSTYNNLTSTYPTQTAPSSYYQPNLYNLTIAPTTMPYMVSATPIPQKTTIQYGMPRTSTSPTITTTQYTVPTTVQYVVPSTTRVVTTTVRVPTTTTQYSLPTTRFSSSFSTSLKYTYLASISTSKPLPTTTYGLSYVVPVLHASSAPVVGVALTSADDENDIVAGNDSIEVANAETLQALHTLLGNKDISKSPLYCWFLKTLDAQKLKEDMPSCKTTASH